MMTVAPEPQYPPPTPAPTGNGKVYAAALAGALTTILAWALDTFAHVTLPAEIQGALQTLIIAGSVYLTPHGGGN